MDVNSWFRRSFNKLKITSQSHPSSAAPASDVAPSSISRNIIKGEEEQLYGVTDRLVEFVKSFSIETFRSFSLPDGEGSIADGGNSGNLRKDLSDWQENHAMLVLSRVKELSQLRFKLCPRYLKEQQFWRIYFALVRSYVTEYELRAVRLAKLKQIRAENDNVSNSSACEVEMSDVKVILPPDSGSSVEQK
ncbi:uncharacterized protein [Primulina huaijiensis]|uniref:uncharacterized protein n=1 Tax=Primulina huaijiensis TaxID=1492673 RepID=UPI003CC77D25